MEKKSIPNSAITSKSELLRPPGKTPGKADANLEETKRKEEKEEKESPEKTDKRKREKKWKNSPLPSNPLQRRRLALRERAEEEEEERVKNDLFNLKHLYSIFTGNGFIVNNHSKLYLKR
jgi:hypothetical protein